MTFIEPLDLRNILVYTLAGNELIFTFLFIIVMSSLAAKFRMPNLVFGVMLTVAGVILAPYIGGLYLILILITGFLTFNAIANMFR